MTQRHITRYATEAAYDSDFDNLDFPNVSYIDEGDEVRYSEENPYLITGKSTATEPFTLVINNTDRTVTLDPTTGDWKINIKPYMPLTSLSRFCLSASSLTEVNIPKSFDTSKVTDISFLFYYRENLTSLPDISGWDTSSVTKMERVFAGCNNLTTFPDISGWNVSSVTDMSEMFNYLNILTSLPDLSGWDTSSTINMLGTFSECRNLTSLGVPPIGDGTKSVDTTDMFWQDYNLTNIPSCGAIHNTVQFDYCPLTLASAKVVLNALSTPYNGAQTLTFSTATKGYINADSEALAIVADKQAIGWTIAL